MKMKNQKGFTLIELLVVIAIIGVLSTLAITTLNSARAKSRDAKRITDIKQIQTGLELYYADEAKYPLQGVAFQLGNTQCLNRVAGGFEVIGAGACGQTIYLSKVPQDPTNSGDFIYSYMSGAGGDVSTYTLSFKLETKTGGVGPGASNATPSGMSPQ